MLLYRHRFTIKSSYGIDSVAAEVMLLLFQFLKDQVHFFSVALRVVHPSGRIAAGSLVPETAKAPFNYLLPLLVRRKTANSQTPVPSNVPR